MPDPYRALALLEELKVTFAAKNADYGATDDPWANFREAEKLGVSPFLGCLIRMSDKWRRVQNLTLKGEEARAVKSESLLDTLRDLAVYAVIAICLLEEEHAARDDPSRF